MATHPADAALAALREDGPAKPHGEPFTSGLSVDEAILLRRAHYQPAALVTGAAVYHLGRVRRSWWTNQEVTQLTEALYSARRDALNRLVAGAHQGASGIAGVRLNVSFFEGNLARFIATGTALAGGPPRPPDDSTTLFTSDLSGQELYLLHQVGLQPVGLVMGCCVYHVGRRKPSRWLSMIPRTQEMRGYTDALYDARERAVGRMQQEAHQLNAEGVVGVQVLEQAHIWGSRIIEFLAIGTAVHRGGDASRLKPSLVAELADTVHAVTPGALSGAPADRAGPTTKLAPAWRVALTAIWLAIWILAPAFSGQAPSGQLPAAIQIIVAVSALGALFAPFLYGAGSPSAPSLAIPTALLGLVWSFYEIGLPGRHALAECLLFTSAGAASVASALANRRADQRGLSELRRPRPRPTRTWNLLRIRGFRWLGDRLSIGPDSSQWF